VTQTAHENAGTTSTTYTATGKRATSTDELGRVTKYRYDVLDRLVTTTRPDGTSTSQTYDAENHRVSSTDAAGNVTRYAYDPVGRLVRTTYADNAATSTVYDGAGNAVQTVDELGHVRWTAYDADARVTSMTDPLGAATLETYDAAGNQVSLDPVGRTTTYAYDADNRRRDAFSATPGVRRDDERMDRHHTQRLRRVLGARKDRRRHERFGHLLRTQTHGDTGHFATVGVADDGECVYVRVAVRHEAVAAVEAGFRFGWGPHARYRGDDLEGPAVEERDVIRDRGCFTDRCGVGRQGDPVVGRLVRVVLSGNADCAIGDGERDLALRRPSGHVHDAEAMEER
jgi:YD repeat-containing protein